MTQPQTMVRPTADALIQRAIDQSMVKARAAGEGHVVFPPSPDMPGSIQQREMLIDPAMRDMLRDQIEHPKPPPPQLPSQLGPFNTGYISFDNGVPVGGWFSLTLYQDGSYAYSGYFHDSGAPSYNVEADFAIVSQSGKAFTFSHSGETHGTFDPGSRDFNFSDIGQNDDIKNAWADLCAAYTYRWSAYCNWDVKAAIDDVLSALKVAGTVITAVVTVVAIVA